jgi:hypothetical protein
MLKVQCNNFNKFDICLRMAKCGQEHIEILIFGF